MRIGRLELRLVELPLVHAFETSFGRIAERRIVLVRVEEDRTAGYGECVTEEAPYYCAETNRTAWHIIRDFIAPRIVGVDFEHPRDIVPALSAIRGHQMAKAAVEMAAWDLYARQRHQPLSVALGGVRERIASGASVGIQGSIEELVVKVGEELAAGYQRIKLKVKPGWDIEAVDAVRQRYGAVPLMVDANAAYTLRDADHLARFDAFELMMIEQPLAYDDLADHARLQAGLATPICLDESITSVRAAEAAIAAGAARIINIKPGRVGGFRESIRLHDLCASRGVPVWHGGMLESGIGRAANLHLSSLAGFTLPGDVAASRRYFDPDLIDPPITMATDGTIAVPTGLGLGVAIPHERVERATLDRLVVDARTVAAGA